MKKFIIIFLIISLIVSQVPLLSARAQFSVPVSDPAVTQSLTQVINAINGLQLQIESILDTTNQILADELSLLNKNITDLLTLNAINKVENTADHFLTKYKVYNLIEDMKSVVSMNKVKSPKDIEEELEEAKIAGILKAIREFDMPICLSESGKENLIKLAAMSYLAYDERFKDTFWNKIYSVPLCPNIYEGFIAENNLKKQKSFLSYLTKPINIGLLAQTNPSNNNNYTPSITITPKISESVQNDLTNEFVNSFFKYIDSESQKAVERRSNQIGKVTDIEVCIDFTFDDKGTFICTEYETITDFDEIASVFESVNVINNLSLVGGVKGTSGLKSDISVLNITKNVLDSVIDFTSSTLNQITQGTVDIVEALAITASTTVGSAVVELTESLKRACSDILPPSATDPSNPSPKTEGLLSKSLSLGKCLERTAEFGISLVNTTIDEIKVLAWFVTSYEKAVNDLIKRTQDLRNIAQNQGKPGLVEFLIKLENKLNEKKNIFVGGSYYYGHFAQVTTQVEEGEKLQRFREELYKNLNELRRMNRIFEEVANEAEEVFNDVYNTVMNTIRDEVRKFFENLAQSAISFITSMFPLSTIASNIVNNASNQLTQLAEQNKKKYNKVQRYINAVNDEIAKWLREKKGIASLQANIGDIIKISVNISTNLYDVISNFVRLRREGRVYSRSIAFTEYMKLKRYKIILDVIEEFLTQETQNLAKNICYIPPCRNPRTVFSTSISKNKLAKKENNLIIVKTEYQKNKFSIFNLANIFNWRSIELNLSK